MNQDPIGNYWLMSQHTTYFHNILTCEPSRTEVVLAGRDGMSSDKVVCYPSLIFITSNILIQQPHCLCIFRGLLLLLLLSCSIQQQEEEL